MEKKKNYNELPVETQFHLESFKRGLDEIRNADQLRDLSARCYKLFLTEKNFYNELKRIDDKLISHYRKMSEMYFNLFMANSFIVLICLFFTIFSTK